MLERHYCVERAMQAASVKRQAIQRLRLPDLAERSQTHLLELLLTSGGDERIAIDAMTGRSRYGTPAGLATDEVWFASSTASAISSRGYAAAGAALRAMADESRSFDLSSWFDRLRTRLVALFGIPGTAVVLTGSGTDAELIALTIARAVLPGPITNIIVAPTETGSGVALAAGGRHFLATTSCQRIVPKGEPLAGFATADIRVEGVAIRSADGRMREAVAVDQDATCAAGAALKAGRAVLLHILDASKTGRAGLQRATAANLLNRATGRVLVLVDACQLRCSADQIRADLNAGSMVMITGSKFAGGPPFAGALLLPPAIVAQLGRFEIPVGLDAYSAILDWPAPLRDHCRDSLTTPANLGLGLRWAAALAELDSFARIDPSVRSRIAQAFGSIVRAEIEADPSLILIDEQRDEGEPDRTIFPVVMMPEARGDMADLLRERLRSIGPGERHGNKCVADRSFHLGQPVAVGSHAALRVCLSVPLVVDVADRLGPATDVDAAIRPLGADVVALFRKWAAIRSEYAAG